MLGIPSLALGLLRYGAAPTPPPPGDDLTEDDGVTLLYEDDGVTVLTED